MLTLQLPKESEEMLSFFAKKAGKDTNSFAKEAMLSLLEDMEDIYMADKAKAEILAGGKVYSWEEAKRELES